MSTIQFSYKEDIMSNHKVFIWAWGIILLVSYLACSMFWGFDAPSLPFSFLGLFVFYLWIRRWERNNENKEREMALNIIKDYLEADVIRLYGKDVTVCSVGYYFLRDDKDDRFQCVLAYLSNEKTLQYNVKHLVSDDDDVRCCEIDIEPKETEDRKLVRTVAPHFKPLLYLSPKNDFKVRMILIYTAGFLVIVVGLLSIKYFNWIAPACLLGYMSVLGLLAYVCHVLKWFKIRSFFAKRLYRVFMIVHYSVPAICLAIVLFLSLCLALAVPCGILLYIEKYTDIEVVKSVHFFACLVLTSIILVHHDNYIREYIIIFLFKHDFEQKKKTPIL